MHQVDSISRRRKRAWVTLAIAAVTSASVVTVTLPAASNADPEPAPPSVSTVAAIPPPGAPGTQEGQPVDPNAVPPPVVDPHAPESGRVTNVAGGFSFVLPAGWVESDASRLDYGSALFSKVTGQSPTLGQPPPVADDTHIVLGRLDQKLYASAEATNSKAAIRLGSDMGEFFMPYPGMRINQEAVPLNADDLIGSASYYEVKFSDPAKLNGQIWTGVIGSSMAEASDTVSPQRWFVVWLGSANDPVDKGAAKALAESIRPWTPPSAPAPEAVPGAPAPVAPAGKVAPISTPTPPRILPA